MRRVVSLLMIVGVMVLWAAPAWARVPISLSGSPASMVRQNGVAQDQGYAFARTPEEVLAMAARGELVALVGNDHLEVDEGVSFPYARPEMRLFIERLAEQYHTATGERLVVTSLTRPTSDQPRNSHQLSVHPAGIAVDLRVSDRSASRQWLESVLLKLERQGLLDVTRERRPPHYHVALFPDSYRSHVEEMIGADLVAAALEAMVHPPEEEPAAPEPIPVTAVGLTTAVVDADAADGLSPLVWIPLALLALFGLRYEAGRVSRRFIAQWMARR